MNKFKVGDEVQILFSYKGLTDASGRVISITPSVPHQYYVKSTCVDGWFKHEELCHVKENARGEQPIPTAKPEFKVGDKVDVKVANSKWYDGIIESITYSAPHHYYIRGESVTGWFEHEELRYKTETKMKEMTNACGEQLRYKHTLPGTKI